MLFGSNFASSFENHLKKLNLYDLKAKLIEKIKLISPSFTLQVKSKRRLKACIFGLKIVSGPDGETRRRKVHCFLQCFLQKIIIRSKICLGNFCFVIIALS